MFTSVEEIADIIEDKNYYVDKDVEENRLFGDDNKEITSPDLDEPNFNEMKELKSSIKDTYSLPFDFVISSGFISHLSKTD